MDRRPDGPEIRFLATGLEIRETPVEGGATVRTLSGTVVEYDKDSVAMRDWLGDEFVETIAPGAFDQAIRENTIKALWSHDTSRVLGSTAKGTLRLRSDATGLYFECDLPDTTAGNDAYTSIKRGDVDGMSFGFKARKDKWSKQDRGAGKPPLFRRSLLDADLKEISPVAFPAYPSSDVAVRSLDQFRDSLKASDLEHRKRKLTLELELMG